MAVTVVLVSPRVAGGQLSLAAWDALRAGGPVVCGDLAAPHAAAVAAAGVPLAVCRAEPADVLALDRGDGVVWLGGEEAADAALLGALGARAATIVGAADLPGARLLDAVAVMDRLRSPGGCPWDAAQTHATLAPYLLEEAYEAYQALEDDDGEGLREELGDVLLQVLFHARLAQEEQPGWSVDDVATALVTKLVGRHPHVFGPPEAARVRDAAEVELRWEELKAAEKARTSVTDGVPLAMAALALAAKLQRRAARLGLPGDVFEPGSGLGADLWRAVAGAGAGQDAETALRAVARRFRDELAAVELAARAQGLDPAGLDPAEWRARWQAGEAAPAR